MLFHEHSVALRIAIAAVSLFPYVTLALTGKLRSWPMRLVQSPAAPILFLLTFFLMALLFTNFEWVQQGHSTVFRVLFFGAGSVAFIFPGLVLVIATSVLAVAFRSFQIHFVFVPLSILAHIVFIYTVTMFLFYVDWMGI
jgi:hypothetical protein